MKFAILALSLFVGSFAQADGFECVTDSLYNIKVYNHTSPEVGTRVPAVMIISDGSVAGGRKTVAKFLESKGVLTSEGAHAYIAKVDLRMKESKRKGELLPTTKLGNVSEIRLDVNFMYNRPVDAGTRLAALLTVSKRDGTQHVEMASCSRYLKN